MGKELRVGVGQTSTQVYRQCTLDPADKVGSCSQGHLYIAQMNCPDKVSRIVAVKIVKNWCRQTRRTLAGTPSLKSVSNEAAVLSHLSESPHPNVLQMIGAFSNQRGDVNLLLEPASSSLEQLVERMGGRVEEHLAFCFLKQILSGLTHVHQKGIVHLDLNMENILVFDRKDCTEEKIPALKLADFGSALFLENNCDRLTPRLKDVFACGIVMFQMLFGRKPFHKACSSDSNYLSISYGDLDQLFSDHGIQEQVSPAARKVLSILLCPKSPWHLPKAIIANSSLFPQ